MKKILLGIILIFIALHSIAQSNNIYTKGTKWIYVIDYELSEDFYFSDMEIMFETITDDTIINNITYKKTINEYLSIWPEYDETNYSKYQGDMLRYSDGKYLRYYKNETYRKGFKEYAPEKFLDDDHVMYDENLKVGDSVWWEKNQKIAEIGDTIFDASPTVKRKYWRHSGHYGRAEERDVYGALNDIWWIEGIGRLSYPYYYAEDYSTLWMLMCCINADGDTIYKNNKYMDAVAPYFKTVISGIAAKNVSITPADGGCLITLDTVTGEWTATLYNSNGVTVAQQQGNGNEIFLSTDSKGTHILVVKAGGRVVKKKILLK